MTDRSASKILRLTFCPKGKLKNHIYSYQTRTFQLHFFRKYILKKLLYQISKYFLLNFDTQIKSKNLTILSFKKNSLPNFLSSKFFFTEITRGQTVSTKITGLIRSSVPPHRPAAYPVPTRPAIVFSVELCR